MAHVNRLWFVTNVNSGTATPDRCEAPAGLDAGVTIRNQESPKMFLSTKEGEKTAA